MTWPHPLISKHTMIIALWSANASPDWKLPTVPEMESLQSLFMLKRREKLQPVSTIAILQPAKTATMCKLCHDCARPSPPFPTFFKNGEFHCLGVFEAIDTLYVPYRYFQIVESNVVLITWASVFSINSLLEFMTLPHPLICKLTMVRVLQPVNTSPDGNCLHCQEWSLYNACSRY